MRLLYLLLFLLITNPCLAAPPSRAYVYTAGDPILSAEVSANEDSIFNYLQSGVDNIFDGTIVNADINASANIAATKLNLTSISQDVTISGNLVVSGGGTIDGPGVVPVGGIIMWSGSIATIPTGWELADGTCTISCPDLTNQFVVGADADDGGVAKSTITGSAAQSGGSTTISVNNMPAHNHNFVAAGTIFSTDDNPGTPANYLVADNATDTDSTATMAATEYLQDVGGGTAYTQPFYALAYIIRTL